jgi:uncharacterized protein (DUF2252 family)
MITVGGRMQEQDATAAVPDAGPAALQTRAERQAAGKALRSVVPRESHAEWVPGIGRHDPVEVLEESNRDRLPELVPVRYGRMLRSPFTFLRGSAGLMAYDLASTPQSGLRVQACGDCHLLNFGLFATPERNLVFDINDFDETLPAPWEWDVKRLATSFVVAARDGGHAPDDARLIAETSVRAYREHMRDCSKASPLEVWYERLDVDAIIRDAPDEKSKKIRQALAAKARKRVGEFLFPKIVSTEGGGFRFVDQPPLLMHVGDADTEERLREGIDDYRRSLPDDRRVLFDRYRLEDIALKVVGIGSVGTGCFVAVFATADGHPLLLQFKEAKESVLAPHAGPSAYGHQGQRIVVGQRLMQSSSDIFLGWARGRLGREVFGRQLRDMKFSAPVEALSPTQLRRYAQYCGRTLARAHARSGDAAAISGYLGKSTVFDEAVGSFAVAYADQTEQDHAALARAITARRIDAVIEQGV